MLNCLAASATASYLLQRTSSTPSKYHAALHGDIVFTVAAGILAASAVVAAVVYPNGKVTVGADVERLPVG